tara:strand:- start:227 stop:466 length:240 start_codon:yes stop_codon:yes gene_type:complete
MEIEFRIIDDDSLPPILITMDSETEKPRVLINQYHRIWTCLNRGVIGGIGQALPEKINEMLNGYLKEQRVYESMDRGEE